MVNADRMLRPRVVRLPPQCGQAVLMGRARAAPLIASHTAQPGASPSPSPQRHNRGDRQPRRSLKLWESIRQSPCRLNSGRRECVLGRGLKVHGHRCCSRTVSKSPLVEIRFLRIGSPAARIVTPRVELLEMGVWNGPHQDSNIENGLRNACSSNKEALKSRPRFRPVTSCMTCKLVLLFMGSARSVTPCANACRATQHRETTSGGVVPVSISGIQQGRRAVSGSFG
ncbi:hypothetical protein F5144DRAFT_315799 [Chaetomium tenue]|uniref:Uncharacterized protein n=1 Tax=Chaetomium tenue TaxID=1854479 RepID=A0ACB7P6Q5_9PEZI|nr:hypothetical protein F5144DRAFT_315799 [Chaetomium globosum]